MFAASVLNPSFTQLTEPASSGEPRMPWLRTPLLWVAVMAGPLLLLAKGWAEDAMVTDAPVIAVGCMVTFGLVVGRMQALVSRVNTQAAVLAEQAEQLTEMASRDGLTGVLNRRSWDRVLAEGLAHAERHHLGAIVVLLDIDHFKRYNDTFGHQAGDRLLRGAAAAWGGHMRPGDMLARYGGEEFIVLLPGCDSRTAMEIVHRLRQATPEEQTFSAGIAAWNGTETAEELVARADTALYAAKHNGRNRSVVAGDDDRNHGNDLDGGGLRQAADLTQQ